MAIAQAQLGSTFALGQYHFGTLAAANADGTLNPFGLNTAGATKEYVAPFAGSIIGFAGTLSAALTTGTLIFSPTINGSLCPPLPDAASLRTNQTKSHYGQDARTANYQFVAGDSIGVMYNKAGTVNPTTLDVNAELVVMFEGIRA